MLEQIFLKVMDMSRGAGLIIVIVIVSRILLKRFPKYLSYMLWSAVLFRLLCPFTPQAVFGILPDVRPVYGEPAAEGDLTLTAETDGFVIPYVGEETMNTPETVRTVPERPDTDSGKTAEISWPERFVFIGKYVWLSGVGILFLYAVLSAVRIHRKTAEAIHFKDNLYLMNEPFPPFVMGIVKPRIYLPGNLGEKEQEYMILHEQVHIRRFDHVVKLAAFAALCIHWFNPLVWVAFVLSCRDMEMSCDEAVIKKLGVNIRADYSASLLAVSVKHHFIRGLPVGFGEGDIKGRIRNLAAFRKTKKGIAALLAVCAGILILCLATAHKTAAPDAEDPIGETAVLQDDATPGGPAEPALGKVSVDIAQHYAAKVGDPSNFYLIDENGVLWGSGRNEYGQLGQGTRDDAFHDDAVKIAEHVIHVDDSQKGFAIFLTEDHKLYGMGNAGSGALQQYGEFDWTRYINGEQYGAATPVLLMEDVVYACCGRDDIACLKEDGTVWIWGTVGTEGGYLSRAYFVATPQKILENAVWVTGGWFNHAALLRDGTVWTWGYNSAGNCGVADAAVVEKPTVAAKDAVMVWTNLAVAGYPQPDAEESAVAWQESLQYQTDCDTIAEFDGIYPRYLNNTVIQKTDGSYWVCGEHVGTEEKVVHGAEGEYSVVCSHEFLPCSSGGTDKGEPSDPVLTGTDSRQADFEKEHISCDAKLNQTYTSVIPCYNNPNYTTIEKVTFSDYAVFSSDESHEALEGYEWKTVSMTYVIDDENGYQYGISFHFFADDYYNRDAVPDEFGEIYTLNYNGTEYDACVGYSEYETTGWIDGVFTAKYTFSFRVPKGYDGCVIRVPSDGGNNPADPAKYDINFRLQ